MKPVEPPSATGKHPIPKRYRRSAHTGLTLYAEGEPMVWMTGGALAIALLMIVGMLGFVAFMGAATFWPRPIVDVHTHDGQRFLGEITRRQRHVPPPTAFADLDPDTVETLRRERVSEDGETWRRLVRTGNFDLTGTRFHWISDVRVASQVEPEWPLTIERMEWGPFYGFPEAFSIDGEVVADTPEAVWAEFGRRHGTIRSRREERRAIERLAIGRVNRSEEQARLNRIEAERRFEQGHIDADALAAAQRRFAEVHAWAETEHAALSEQIRELNRQNARYALVMRTSDDRRVELNLAELVRAYPANRLGFAAKLRVFAERWHEFLTADPREANSEGGVLPAIVGTVTMTLVMTLMVVPFGVLAALYLREYAKSGPMVSAVRIAINNLAGVPSIVFGVFGLGFFCYIFGAQIDEWFYAARLPAPTFRKGGVLWASLTLALLTLPVVIVATEEALAAVPGSMREGSYACGASKWQTIKRIVLPRAMPGIMTGMILAMARGAGEVAPLMLVGAVKLAPDLPLDFSNWSGSLGPLPTGPIHLERSFMHLGFHIYDVGFQSPDSEAARPMVFTTTLLLIGIIVLLNLSAIALRSRLKRRFAGSTF